MRNLKELAAAITQLETLPPIERVQAARALSDTAKTILSTVGDAAVVDALTDATYAEVAAKLGVSEAAVNKAVTRHRNRQK
jgi:DNA-directed RNA polymerase specialized sigma24 family protein